MPALLSLLPPTPSPLTSPLLSFFSLPPLLKTSFSPPFPNSFRPSFFSPTFIYEVLFVVGRKFLPHISSGCCRSSCPRENFFCCLVFIYRNQLPIDLHCGEEFRVDYVWKLIRLGPDLFYHFLFSPSFILVIPDGVNLFIVKCVQWRIRSHKKVVPLPPPPPPPLLSHLHANFSFGFTPRHANCYVSNN